MASSQKTMIQPALPEVCVPPIPKSAPAMSPVADDSLPKTISCLDLNDAVGATDKSKGSRAATPAPSDEGAKSVANMQPQPDDDVFVDTANNNNSGLELAAPALSGPYGYSGFVPRPDRVAQAPNANNAQGLYPPDALIFVANLSNQRTKDQLELACHRVFDAFGRNHIKVKYDRNNHPFAFVQYENAPTAKAAIDNASDVFIDGRKIRMERAKAERSVVLSKREGGTVSVDEARGLLSQYGPIEKLYALPSNSMRSGWSAQVYVKFAFWADCRDALRGMQNNGVGYLVLMAPGADSRTRFSQPGPMVKGHGRSLVDQKSIFVGNLPETVTRPELEELFTEFGVIIQVNIIRKPYGEDSVNIFSFIEFDTPESADVAATAERSLHGVKLRVEPKEYSVRRGNRRYEPATPMRQNTPRQFTQPQFGHGSMGYNNGYGAHMQTTPPAYIAGYPMQSFTPGSAPPFGTPPSAAMSRMLPAGMFTPSPAPHMPAMHAPFHYGSPAPYGPAMHSIQEEYEG